IPAGRHFRIVCAEGPQVGDLNLFSADWSERFWSGKTRALHGTHLTVGDRLWSALPTLRPMATIVEDSLGWYGLDADGCGVHDVIGTRCDPYTAHLLGGAHYHHCCHSNLTRAIVAEGFAPERAEAMVHDVLNVFMATGFDARGRYVMKASPVRPGDRLTFRADIDLIAVLSTCPGGDCGQGHSSDAAACHPLRLERLEGPAPRGWSPPPPSGYDRSHGL
ncbi:MAG: urea carboxylase-associated family protein, partial [Hasllibacter sp.]